MRMYIMIDNVFINTFIATCAPGTYLNVEFRQCLRCAHGTYQDEYGAFDCKVCPKNSTTKNTGIFKNDTSIRR
jgi:hypothetical protein